MNQFKTDSLCASSSFLMGVGSVLAIQGDFYDYNRSEDPDGIAIAQDWKMVGQDIRGALSKSGIEISGKKVDTARK